MSKIYTTSDGVDIFVEPGKKSKYDFKGRYQESGKRKRNPKHIHLIIDLLIKKENDEDTTMELVDHMIEMIQNVREVKFFPPSLQQFTAKDVKKFSTLNQYGDYSAEFLLVVTELIMIQEKTNYPDGTMSIKLFEKFRNGADIFSIVSAATFR